MAPPSRYHLVVFVLIYFLPLLVMFVAYSVIGLTLWKRAVPRQQAHGANLRHLQAKKKVRAEAERAGPAPGGTGGGGGDGEACPLGGTGEHTIRVTQHLRKAAEERQTSAIWRPMRETDFFMF